MVESLGVFSYSNIRKMRHIHPCVIPDDFWPFPSSFGRIHAHLTRDKYRGERDLPSSIATTYTNLLDFFRPALSRSSNTPARLTIPRTGSTGSQRPSARENTSAQMVGGSTSNLISAAATGVKCHRDPPEAKRAEDEDRSRVPYHSNCPKRIEIW